jgi:multidrug resistance protein, MATE family
MIFINCFVPVYYETKSVTFFQKENLMELGQQVSRGFGSLFMGCWSWWAMDIFTLMASYLGTTEVSAQTAMRSMGLLTFMIPVGFAAACGFYVSKFIGQGSAEHIRHYYNVSTSLSVIVGAVQIFFLIIFETAIINLYEVDTETAAQMRYCWPVFLTFVMFDTTQGIGGSAIRSSGKQKWGAFVTGVGYWAVGIPLAIVLAFKLDTGL